MRIKHLFAGLLITALAGTSLSGCNSKGSNRSLPEFDQNAHIIRSAWWCPEPTAENYKLYKESGLNTVMLVNHNFRHDADALEKDPVGHTMQNAYYIGTPDGFEGETMTDKALATAKETGLDVILAQGDSYFEWVGAPYNAYEDFTIDYEEYQDIIVGLFSGDEPNAEQIPELAKDIPNAEKVFPDIPYFANLFPNYADVTRTLKTNTYNEYLDIYAEEFLAKTNQPRMVSIDFYPFIGSNCVQWLTNYENFTDMAMKYDADIHMFIQSAVSADGSHRLLSDKEILVQVNTAIAYGADAYSYFLYSAAGDGYPEGLVDQSGQPASMYYSAQEANKQVAAMESAYKHYDYVNTIPLTSDDNQYAVGAFSFLSIGKQIGTTDESKVLKEATSTNRALVTILRDDDGNEAFYLTNYFDAGDAEMEEDCTFTLTFENMQKVALYGSSEYLSGEIKNLSESTYTCTLAPGEGILVIPFQK